MNEPKEADVVIEGETLTYAESMTLRVSVTAFLMDMQQNGLGDDENGRAMSEGYQHACKTILSKMLNNQASCEQCGQRFRIGGARNEDRKRSGSRFCSDQCRWDHNNEKRKT